MRNCAVTMDFLSFGQGPIVSYAHCQIDRAAATADLSLYEVFQGIGASKTAGRFYCSHFACK